MYKRTSSFLIVTTLFCSLCGVCCQEKPIEPTTEQTPSTSYEEIEFAPTPQPTLPQATLPQPVSPFWDYDDVDISYIDKNRKLIALTFDDAPSKTLENILAVFATYNENNPDCKATSTVFCNGHLWSNTGVHTLSAAYAMGWELGNHTYSHFDLTTLSAQEVTEQIERTETLLYKIDKKSEHLLRVPFGHMNEHVKSLANVPFIDWAIDTLDWTGVSAQEIYDVVLSQKFSGAIVLMHDGYDNTVTALKQLLPALKEAGYQAVSVSAMAKMHDCRLKRGGVYIRARKNGRQ